MAVERELTPWTCDFKCSLCGLYTEDDAVSFAVDYGDGLGALFRRVTVCRPCLDVLGVRPKTREGGA